MIIQSKKIDTSNTRIDNQIKKIITGVEPDPFHVLGAHHHPSGSEKGIVVRTFIPGAKAVSVLDLDPDKKISAQMLLPDGFFEALLPDKQEIFPYRLQVDFKNSQRATFYDCYSFTPILTEFDFHLFNQGDHDQIYEKLGAHPLTHQGINGFLFAVWAPSASRVSVIGDFNQWNGLRHQMRNRGTSGIWELFIPHLGTGQIYKFEVRTQTGDLLIKSDPYAFFFEKRPKSASITYDLRNFEWTDHDWMKERAERESLSQPMAIYEVHLGSWRRRFEQGNRWLSYREAAEELIAYVKEMGFNAIEFMPMAEHPFDASWGYQVTGFYAPTSRFGTPDDFMYLVDSCHAADLTVILDWVPAHFPKDAHGLEYFDGTHLYEHSDPRQGLHQDWDTLIFNYGRNEVKNFLVANALFWLDKYHIDGLRIDAVASMIYLDYSRKEGEWIPNCYGGRENLEAIEFIKTLNSKVYKAFPGAITIAEESTAWPGVTSPVHLGGLGFMFKWNMGWMHDMLTFMSKDSIHRRFHMDNLTFALLYAFHENFILPLSHDEVVHGKGALLSKMPGDDWQKFANLRLLFGYMYGEPGKKILFMGGEFGQWHEWDHDQALQWDLLQYEPHKKLQHFVKDLNKVYLAEPAMHEFDFDPKGFEWIDFRDTDASIISFIRRGNDPDQILLFIFNFTSVPRMQYRIGAPLSGYYREILNSDATCYGGSNIGLEGGIMADNHPWHGQPCLLNLNIPPLGMLILKPIRD